MIIDAIIVLIVGILTPVFSVLPTSEIGLLDLTAYADEIDAIGRHGAIWNGLTPLYEVLYWSGIVMGIMLPAVMIYKTANWVYKHIPQIGGFGPGSG